MKKVMGKYTVPGTKVRKRDNTTSRNVKTHELRVERDGRNDASMPEIIGEQEKGPFRFSGGA